MKEGTALSGKNIPILVIENVSGSRGITNQQALNKRYISSNDIVKALSNADVEMIYHRWADKFEADVIGAYITLTALEHTNSSKWIRFMGIYLCMSMFELQQKISALKFGKTIISNTHPSGRDRKSS